MLQTAKYRDDIQNTFKIPPLVSKHKITPSAYAALNKKMVEEDRIRRQSKTPMVIDDSLVSKFIDQSVGTSRLRSPPFHDQPSKDDQTGRLPSSSIKVNLSMNKDKSAQRSGKRIVTNSLSGCEKFDCAKVKILTDINFRLKSNNKISTESQTFRCDVRTHSWTQQDRLEPSEGLERHRREL